MNDEISELLEEGRVFERRLRQIKERLIILSKIYKVDINLDDWEVKK